MPTTAIQRAFTSKHKTIQTRIITSAKISYNGASIDARSLWDTGATCSCVSTDVVKRLNLTPISKMDISTPSGEKEVGVYLIDIILPNNVELYDVQVCDSEIGSQGLDFLIGMNIISMGDFSITNYNGETTFSFRTPPSEHIDFVKDIKIRNITGVHGKGKRKRKK